MTLSNIAAFRKRHGLEPQTADRKINRGDGASGSGSAGSFPIGVSIMGHPRHGSEPSKKLDGVVECVRKALPLADFIEINESCPNVAHGGGSKAGNAAGRRVAGWCRSEARIKQGAGKAAKQSTTCKRKRSEALPTH